MAKLIDRDLLLQTLELTGWNESETARRMAISVAGIRQYLKRNELENNYTVTEFKDLAISQAYMMLKLGTNEKTKLKLIEWGLKLALADKDINLNLFDGQADTNIINIE